MSRVIVRELRLAARGSRQDARRASSARPRCGAVAMAAALVALAVPTTAVGADWLDPVDLSSPQSSANCGFLASCPGAAGVDVAVNSRGDTMAAWIRRSEGTNAVVQTAFRPSGGTFGAPQTVGAAQGAYVFGFLGPLADVAMDDQGNAVLVWPVTKNGRTVIESAVRPAGGAFGPPIDLTADDQNANPDPRVTISKGTGEAVAVWSRSNGANTIVQASTKPSGGAFAPPTNLSVSGANATNARIAMNRDGAAVVTWLRFNGSHNIVQTRVRPAGTSTFAAVQELSAASQNAAGPEVAIDDAGRATVVWSRPDGTQTRIQSRFLNSAGVIGAAVDDLSDAGRDGFSPQIALDSENTAVAVWRACNAGASTGCVVESATRPSGGSFGSVAAIGPPSDSSFTLPRLAMDQGGTATAVWSDFGGTRVRAARRPRGGSFGAVDEISPANGQSLEPSVSTDDEGSAVVGWAYFRSDGLQLAQAATFDSGAPTLTSVNVPGTATTGSPAAMSAAASDRWSGAALTWDFGDGASGAGESVSHAFGAPGVYTVKVTANDGAANSSSAARTIQVVDATPPPPPPPPPPPARATRIVVTMPFAFSKSTAKFTRFTLLQVKGIPRGSTLKVSCKAPKRKKCPAKSYTKKNARGTVSLKKWLKKKLAAGTKLTVTVTKSGNFIGAVKTMTVRKKARPKFTDRCLRPGAKKPSRC